FPSPTTCTTHCRERSSGYAAAQGLGLTQGRQRWGQECEKMPSGAFTSSVRLMQGGFYQTIGKIVCAVKRKSALPPDHTPIRIFYHWLSLRIGDALAKRSLWMFKV